MNKREEIKESLDMIADYMEKGFLENIVDMFKGDDSYYPYIGTLLNDERIGIRIGITALVEILAEDQGEKLRLSIPGLAELLKEPNPTIRGDAANLLGVIGHRDALPFLSKASDDDNEIIREAIEEAIKDIEEAKS